MSINRNLTVTNCYKCDISLHRTNIVSGRGSINSKVVIIGEAPGANEDKTGIPFIGNAGQLLRKLLRLFNIDPTTIYITNVVKCRPDNNRTPTNLEISNCKSYLVYELLTIKPKLVLLLGSTAIRTFYNNNHLSIINERGIIRIVNNIVVLSTYHPSYIIRNVTNLKIVNNFIKDIILFYKLIRFIR